MANAVNVRQVCKKTLDENSNLIFSTAEYDLMLKQCMDKYYPRFNTSSPSYSPSYSPSGYSSGPSALGIIVMFIFGIIIITILYIIIKADIDTFRDKREGRIEEFSPGQNGNITGADVSQTWVHYNLFETFSKDALIAIVHHLSISLPSMRQKSFSESDKDFFLSLMGEEAYEVFREKRPVAFVIYMELARRINRGDYGATSDNNDSTDMTFNCDAFVKHMRDWKRVYKRLVKEGRDNDFSNALNSIKINLNATGKRKQQTKSRKKIQKNKPVKKATFNNMLKSDLIDYAKRQGVIVKSKDTKAQIIDKLPKPKK